MDAVYVDNSLILGGAGAVDSTAAKFMQADLVLRASL